MEDENRSNVRKTVKNGCLSTIVSLQEGLAYVKAFFVGQGKKLMARNEEEAAAADLEASKMQVQAADAAEEAKNRLKRPRKTSTHSSQPQTSL